MIRVRIRTVVVPFIVFFAATFGLLIAARASASTDAALSVAATSPDIGAGVARWWQIGALTAPIALLVFVALIGLERLSVTRWPRLGWLRRGSVRAYLSLSIAGMVGLLPAIADGSVTWGGFAVALLGGLIALRPGGGERPELAEDRVARS